MENLEILSINECINNEVELSQLILTLNQYIDLKINGVDFDYETEAQTILKNPTTESIKNFFIKFLEHGGVSIEEVDDYLNNLYKIGEPNCNCCYRGRIWFWPSCRKSCCQEPEGQYFDNVPEIIEEKE